MTFTRLHVPTLCLGTCLDSRSCTTGCETAEAYFNGRLPLCALFVPSTSVINPQARTTDLHPYQKPFIKQPARPSPWIQTSRLRAMPTPLPARRITLTRVCPHSYPHQLSMSRFPLGTPPSLLPRLPLASTWKPYQSTLHSGLDTAEKKFGQGKVDPTKQRGMNEKATDQARGMFEKATG